MSVAARLFSVVLLLTAAPTWATDVWLSPAEVAQLPANGPAWDRLKAAADGRFSLDHGWTGNSTHNTDVLAAALVAARLGLTSDVGRGYRAKVAREVMAAIRDSSWDDFDGLTYPSRNVAAYVIAADLIDFPSLPGGQADEREFRRFMADWRFHCYGRQSNFEQMADRPNNKGTMAFASEAAIAVYLIKHGVPAGACGSEIPARACVPNDVGQFSASELAGFCADPALELEAIARMFHGLLGNRDRYDGFDFRSPAGDDWQCLKNESKRSGPGNGHGINPKACSRDAHPIGGVLTDDQRRSGGFSWPPAKENYVYTGMQGIVVTATILALQGHDAWSWQQRAIKRAWDWLHTPHFEDGTAFPCTDPAAGSNDGWQAWLVNRAYGTNYPASARSTGFNMAWTEWTHPHPAR